MKYTMGLNNHFPTRSKIKGATILIRGTICFRFSAVSQHTEISIRSADVIERELLLAEEDGAEVGVEGAEVAPGGGGAGADCGSRSLTLDSISLTKRWILDSECPVMEDKVSKRSWTKSCCSRVCRSPESNKMLKFSKSHEILRTSLM